MQKDKRRTRSRDVACNDLIAGVFVFVFVSKESVVATTVCVVVQELCATRDTASFLYVSDIGKWGYQETE